MENDRSCKNCKFFVQHYVIRDRLIQRADCGKCAGKRLTVKEIRKFPFAEGCEKWKQAEPKLKTKEDIYHALEDIYMRLQVIISQIYESEIYKT